MTDSPSIRLSLRSLSIGAGHVRLLENLGLDLIRGEGAAFIAPSGFGKTTLLRAIAGLINPLTGEILLDGKSPEDWGYPEYRRHVLYVSQAPVLLDLSVRENLARPFTYRTARGIFNEKRAAELLNSVGLDADRLAQNARSLSIGQQQRVALVRALLLTPKVLLLDEPTSALDEDSTGLVEGLLQNHLQDGGSLLLVTHDHDLGRRLCRTVLPLARFSPLRPAPETNAIANEVAS